MIVMNTAGYETWVNETPEFIHPVSSLEKEGE